MLLDAVPGSPTANSYVTIEAASAFLEARLDTEAWLHASADAQVQTLVWATALLDSQVRWYGTPTYPSQALALPQFGLVDRWGRAVDSATVGRDVQHATALYGLTLLRVTAPDAPEASEADLIVKSKKIGDTTITYQDISGMTSTRVATSPYAIPNEVLPLLQAYGIVPGCGYAMLVRW